MKSELYVVTLVRESESATHVSEPERQAVGDSQQDIPA